MALWSSGLGGRLQISLRGFEPYQCFQKLENMLELNEVKKDLYKSKEMAKFAHYQKGRLFYEVKILEGTYLFPIHTVEEVEIEVTENGHTAEVAQLSEDLGETSFLSEIKGSELIRWIGKAIKNEEIKKVG
jgi:hypothetical protein